MRLLTCVLFLFLSAVLTAGTIIYKTPDGGQNIMSDVTILAIDGNIVTLKIGKATRNIGRGALVKYYDADIKLSGLFEDGSADYGVSIQDVKMPKTGLLKSKTKKATAEAEVSFIINRKGEGAGAKNARVPYFYLFVLVHNKNDYGGYDVLTYSYPENAKPRGKSYNEAQMLEKVLSADRPLIYAGTAGILSNGGKSVTDARTATFKLTGVGERKILAYYLVVWGKTWIVAEKEERDNETRIGDRWWIRHADD